LGPCCAARSLCDDGDPAADHACLVALKIAGPAGKLLSVFALSGTVVATQDAAFQRTVWSKDRPVRAERVVESHAFA
jgi:hypothetical protein